MDIEKARFNMVEQQIKPWNVTDNNVLKAMFTVKREMFVPDTYKNIAFSDLEIPLPGGQKMLCPKVEARLIQELEIKSTDKVLQIGTGSGYVTALLARLAKFVYSVEINEDNKKFAVHNLTHALTKNVTVTLGNGMNGLPSIGEFDKIFIGAGLISLTDKLKQQIKVGGKLVGFVGKHPLMHAVVVWRITTTKYREIKLFETDIDYLVNEIDRKFKF